MKGTFYGWYMKCQSDSQTFAVIPAVHQSRKVCTCSIQMIMGDNTWNVIFPPEIFRRQGRNLRIGENEFGQNGLKLKIRVPGFTVNGKLDFGTLSPLRYDIMGPFAVIPFLECRHSVWSMRHTVNGTLKAPVTGNMKRTIQEGAACRALYRFCKSGRTVFYFETDKASFEYEY